MFMQTFSSPALTQTDLDIFLTFYQENIRIFQKNSETNFKNIQILVCSLMLQLAKQVHASFNYLASTQTAIATFLTFLLATYGI
jgi:hypothetical protein